MMELLHLYILHLFFLLSWISFIISLFLWFTCFTLYLEAFFFKEGINQIKRF